MKSVARRPGPIESLRALARRATKGLPAVGGTPHDVVWTENKWRLLRFRPVGELRHKTPILLVPSLINRWYVLDLAPGRSFAGWLVEQGHDVYIIDWGSPGPRIDTSRGTTSATARSGVRCASSRAPGPTASRTSWAIASVAR